MARCCVPESWSCQPSRDLGPRASVTSVTSEESVQWTLSSESSSCPGLLRLPVGPHPTPSRRRLPLAVGSLGRRATSILEDPSWELKVQNDRLGPRSRLSVEGESTSGSCSTSRNNYSLLDASNKSDSEWHNIT
jgi:hypothetical protein